MRPIICTYASVMGPAAGPGTWAAVVGIGTCCACAVAKASAHASATASTFCLPMTLMGSLCRALRPSAIVVGGIMQARAPGTRSAGKAPCKRALLSGHPPARHCKSAPLLARMMGTHPHSPDLLQYLVEVVGFRSLQRRERYEGLEFLQPQLLADRQHVPVIDVSGAWRG